eukprot:scaffold9484_cov124-Isochrysis_galbana.AAC.16
MSAASRNRSRLLAVNMGHGPWGRQRWAALRVHPCSSQLVYYKRGARPHVPCHGSVGDRVNPWPTGCGTGAPAA